MKGRLDVLVPTDKALKTRLYLDATTAALVKKLAQYARVEISELMEQAIVSWVKDRHPELTILGPGGSDEPQREKATSASRRSPPVQR